MTRRGRRRRRGRCADSFGAHAGGRNVWALAGPACWRCKAALRPGSPSVIASCHRRRLYAARLWGDALPLFHALRRHAGLSQCGGSPGKVYVTVPAHRAGAGQVEIMLQGRLTMAAAQTDAATLSPQTPDQRYRRSGRQHAARRTRAQRLTLSHSMHAPTSMTCSFLLLADYFRRLPALVSSSSSPSRR